MDYITEKHEQLVEWLHQDFYLNTKWTHDPAIAEHPVLFVDEIDGKYYACVKFDEDLGNPRLIIEKGPEVELTSPITNHHDSIMERIDHFLGSRGKWRAVSEYWLGDTEDTYRAVLFKDEARDKFFLHENADKKEAITELTHIRALNWTQHYDQQHWPEARMRKEFAKPVVDFLLKDRPDQSMPTMDQLSRQILKGGQSKEHEPAHIMVNTLLKDKFNNRFWLGTSQYKSDSLNVEGDGQHVLIGRASNLLFFIDLSDQEAFNWLLDNDGKWNQHRLADYFPKHIVEAGNAERIIQAEKIDPNELLQIDKGWRQIGKSVEGEPDSYSVERLFVSEDKRFFVEVDLYGSEHEFSLWNAKGYRSLFPNDNNTRIEELSEEHAFNWVVDLALNGRSSESLKTYFSSDLVDAFEASMNPQPSVEASVITSVSSEKIPVDEKVVSKTTTESNIMLDAIRKIADKFSLKLFSAFSEKPVAQQQEQRKDMRL